MKFLILKNSFLYRLRRKKFKKLIFDDNFFQKHLLKYYLKKHCIYSLFAAKIYAEVFILKNIKETKSYAKKQLLSGAVYIALAVTVVAVTVSTITASFSQNEVTDMSEINVADKNGDTLVKLPDIPDFSLDTPVKDFTEKQLDVLYNGSDEERYHIVRYFGGERHEQIVQFEGLIKMIEKRMQQGSMGSRKEP